MLTHPEKISYEEIKDAITNIATLEDRALASFAYATGARVSELLQLTKASLFFDKENNVDYLKVICPVLKKRDGKLHERTALVRVDEDWLVKPMVCFSDMVEDGKHLFDMHRMTAYRHLVAAVVIHGEPINPHGFRKLRATHLRRNFGFDSYQLKRFFGWSSISPSEYYVGLDMKDIAY